NLKHGDFKGPIWPVNRRHDRVDDAPAWPDVQSLPGVPDLAVICTPAASVPELIAQLGRKGTRAAIVISSGLRQPSATGEPSFEQLMLDAARPHLLRILGPNCIGALVPGIGLNASFAPGNAVGGTLAFVTQSGALATAMLDWANERGIGFSHFISLGDSADVDFGDILDYLGSDPGTRAILMYVESVRGGRKFMSAARAASRNKPVILVKGGRTPAAAKAASTHTGALAGSDVVFDAAVRRAGVLRVDTLEALFDAAQTLARPHPWRGDKLAVLTNGGGAGVLAADALALGGGMLAVLSEATLLSLDACLPSTWSHGNPVDIGGDAPTARYTAALAVLQAAPEVDGVLFMHAPTAIVPAGDIAGACLPLMVKAAKPVLACWLGGKSVQAARQAFEGQGMPWYSTPERAAAAWLQLSAYYRGQAVLQQLPGTEAEFVPQRDQALAVLADARASGREWLDPAQAQALMQAYGIPAVPTMMARDAPEAASMADQLGFPVALKVVSPQIVHKSDVGGVALGLGSADEVRAAVVRMRQQVARISPQARVLGYALQPMARRPGSIELIAGLASDPVFGPVVLFGQGGTDVELSGHHAVALAPLNASLARDLLARSGLGTVLSAHRGKPGVDEPALADTLVKLSRLACDLQAVAELDINPLMADAQGVLAVDTRVRLRLSGGPRVEPAIRPYPRALEEHLQVDGSDLLIRPVRPQDGEQLKAFYAAASATDMRLRFFLSRREVPLSEVARFSQIDYDREMAFVALSPAADPDSGRIVAEVRAVCDPDNVGAEFAVQVASSFQGRGLGLALMNKMVRYLRERGVSEITGECLPENSAMAALARRVGFVVAAGTPGDILSLRLALRGDS
ncbi:MAG: family N-acetyltransferase, partial [Ramlibacter sp.]|nr:family N-acetyltransferase [Ramlibacter sp.]